MLVPEFQPVAKLTDRTVALCQAGRLAILLQTDWSAALPQTEQAGRTATSHQTEQNNLPAASPEIE